MEIDMAKEQIPHSHPPPQRGFNIAQLSLRILVTSFTLAAIFLAVTSAQSLRLGFGFSFQARYSYSSAFRFKVVADAVVGALSFLSLIFVYAFTRSKWNTKYYFYIFLHDLVLLLLIACGCTAGTAIGFVARYGEEKIGWQAICYNVTKFCHKITLAVVFSYLALVCLLILTIISVSKLKSQATEKNCHITKP